MGETVVTFHDDRPAINVKLHLAGLEFWPESFARLPFSNWPPNTDIQPVGKTTAGDIVDAAYNIVQQDFWHDAQARATELGLGEIEQGGRSGGWLELPGLVGRLPCPEHQPMGTICDDEIEALAGYASLREWAYDFLHTAPIRVRDLAEQIAMDELGQRPAQRMFAPEITRVVSR
jgi:hypothetical protein